MDVPALISEFAANPKGFPKKQLQTLSNLEPSDVADFKVAFPTIPVDARRSLVTWLVDLAEDDIVFNFDSLFEPMVQDTDPEVRIRAIEALWENTDAGLIDTYIDLLNKDPEPGVRAAAAKALGKYELAVELEDRYTQYAPDMDAGLLKAFDNEDDTPDVRRVALESVAVRGIRAIPEAIRKAYASRHRDLKVGAIVAMGLSCDDRWMSSIMEELINDDPEFRHAAVSALGEMADESTARTVAQLVEDPDPQVRLAAIAALGAIGGREATDTLRILSRSADEAIAEAAQDAMDFANLDEAVPQDS